MLKKLGLLSFGLLVLSYHLVQQNYLSLLTDVESTIDLSIKNIENDIERVTKKIDRQLYDDSKMKYRPIGVTVHQVNEKMNKAVDTIAEIEKLIVTKNLSKREIEDIIRGFETYLADLELDLLADYTNLIQEHGRTFGLKKEELEDFIQKHQKFIKFQYQDGLILHHKKLDKNIFPFVFSNTILEIRNVQWRLVEHLAILTGGWPIFCNFGFFPVVTPMQNSVRNGEVFKATIAIFPYDYRFHYSDIQFFVDGERLEFVAGNYFIYKSEPILKTKKIIKMTGLFKNKITNKWETAFTDISYEIRVN